MLDARRTLYFVLLQQKQVPLIWFPPSIVRRVLENPGLALMAAAQRFFASLQHPGLELALKKKKKKVWHDGVTPAHKPHDSITNRMKNPWGDRVPIQEVVTSR